MTPCLARAADTPEIAGIEARIRHLQAELEAVKQGLARRRAAVAAAEQVAAEARAEAREAERRANQAATAAYAGQTQFAAPSSGIVGIAPPPADINGIGGHPVGTAGQQKATPLGQSGRFQLGGVTVQIGGYIDATAIVRSRNEVDDLTTSWNNIPFAQSPLYHEPEFRGSARGSRLALLLEGRPSDVTRVDGYFETDFQSAGVTSNSNQSNSYTLRVRQAYATFDRADWGFHLLAGQAYSLITLDRIGITPRQEQIPLTIDSGYVPGFNYTRNWQLRFAEDFLDRRLWAALSFEGPETLYYVNNANSTGVIGGTPNYDNLGGSGGLLNSTANYSDDIAPDVVAKIAFDPSYGHYEIDGLARFFSDRVTSTVPDRSGYNNVVLGGGGGGGMILPILGPKLFFQASGLAGQGIGRYATGQLPDATIGSNGAPLPLPEVEALIGFVYHPTPEWDLYSYAGTEQIAKRSYDERDGTKLLSFGYGNGDYSNAGCDTEGSALTCTGNTRGLVQGTLGAWWRFLHGPFGTLQVGTQYSYTQRTAFAGTGATPGSVVTPKTDQNVVMFSFRYLPFL